MPRPIVAMGQRFALAGSAVTAAASRCSLASRVAAIISLASSSSVLDKSLSLGRAGIIPPERIGKGRDPPVRYRRAQIGHQDLIEPQIMFGHQHRAENLAGADQMVEIGAAPAGADRAGAGRIE